MMKQETATPKSRIYAPDLAAFRQLAAGSANLIPVYREFAADLETPVSVYLKLMQDSGPSFLLESVEGGERVGRYSFVGVNPRGMISLQGNTVTVSQADAAYSRELVTRDGSCPSSPSRAR